MKKIRNQRTCQSQRYYFSGQVFHFKQTGENQYTGVIEDTLTTFKQVEEGVYHNSANQIIIDRFFNLEQMISIAQFFPLSASQIITLLGFRCSLLN